MSLHILCTSVTWNVWTNSALPVSKEAFPLVASAANSPEESRGRSIGTTDAMSAVIRNLTICYVAYLAQ